MKKLLTSILAAGALSAFGQGQINLDNFTAGGLVPVKLPDGTTAVGDSFKAQVFLDGGKALGGVITFASQTTGARAGRFNGGLVEVPGVAVGAKAKLYVQVWDGDSYDAAKTYKGQSQVFETLALGGNNPGDPLAPKLDGLASFNLTAVGGAGPGPTPGDGGQPVVPEPSTIALGALGAAALVLRFRK